MLIPDDFPLPVDNTENCVHKFKFICPSCGSLQPTSCFLGIEDLAQCAKCDRLIRIGLGIYKSPEMLCRTKNFL